MKYRFISLLVLAALVISGAAAAAQDQLEVTAELREYAAAYAQEYAAAEVAFLFGGQSTLEGYQAGLAAGRIPGEDIGVDASALVRNAYRWAEPNIRFVADSAGTVQFAVNSSALYNFNSRRITAAETAPGDLLFFQNEAGRIIGVGIVTAIDTESVTFITASASAGTVIETTVSMHGAYWDQSSAGFGRLLYIRQP